MYEVPPPAGFDVAPNLVHQASGLRAWLTHPAGVLTQVTTQVRADEDMAEFLSTTISKAALAQPREHGQRLLFVHDWRRLESYTPQTRAILTEWGISIRNDIERVVVALRPESSAIVKMGISVASVALRLAGVRLQIVDSLEDELRKLALRPRRDL